LLAASQGALATNGYFSIGYGGKAMGLGGATTANPVDTLAASTNPAGMAAVSDGFDIGLRLFSPIRSASINCTGIGACGQRVGDTSSRDLFAIPSFGYVRKLNDQMSVGISVYGNGGMNTTFDRNIYDEVFARVNAGGGAPFGIPAGATASGFPNTGKLGVDLIQLILAPTVTYQLSEGQTIGISPRLGANVSARVVWETLPAFHRMPAA